MKALSLLLLLTVCAATAPARVPTGVLKTSALGGDTAAMVVVGSRYLHGDGEKEDLVEAERWYRMAAVRKDFDGVHGMGTVYVNRKDYVTAYAWFALYADEEAGLAEARDDVWSVIPANKQIAAIQKAKSLKEAIPKEQAELLLRHIQAAQKK